MTVILRRRQTGDEGTFGTITLDSGEVFHTGELPDRDNQRDISCIPPGTYRCERYRSPHFGRDVYRLVDVPGHDAVEIHWGNFCGDRAKGYRSDVRGCILLGQDEGELWDSEAERVQHGVRHSMQAFLAFMSAMGGQPFDLTIEAAP